MFKHFLRWAALAKPPRTVRSRSVKLNAEQLPDLVMPALWAVGMGSQWVGTPGDTAATVSGQLSYATNWPLHESGAAIVEAASAAEAVSLAFAGAITVQFGSETLNYQMGPSAFSAAAPFRYLDGAIQLEDMAYSTFGSDFDYNDRFWLVTTTPIPEGGGGSSQSYGYPTMVWITAGAGTTETSPTNGWFVVNRNNTAGALTVNFGVVGSTASDAATLGVDYTILGNGTSVTFAAGASQAFVYIHPLIDAVYGPYGPPDEPFENQIERITLALSAGTGYSVYTPNEAFIQIANVDLVFDLDVNAENGLLDAGIDLAKNYLPGYGGIHAKVSTGTSFNVPVYTGQRMKLVVDGAGTESVDVVNRVEFIIDLVSADPGYTGNRTDPSLEGAGNTEDYSFRRNGREGPILLPLAPSKITIGRMGGPGEEHGGHYGGKMEAENTWVNFWCKDYGGAARLTAKIFIADANAPNGERELTRTLSIPVDTDNDGIADKWEIAMGKRWAAQYGVAEWADAVALTKFNNFDDIEEMDPDGIIAGRPLVAQAETGDAHTVKEEYRGYILNGGSGFAGGHIRLDPARKEILVEVDKAAVVGSIGIGLNGVMNGASGVFSNATRGAGIYMYWLMDEDALNLPKNLVDTEGL